MTRRRRFVRAALAAVGVCAASLLVPAPRAAAAPEAAKASAPEDGAFAPDGCWTTAGGCPARAAAAVTAPVLGPVSVAWTGQVKGRIESEPLAWGNAVYVQSCDNDVHWLTAFSVANGKVLGRKSWRSGAPLLASVWNGIVVVRAAPSRVEAVRLKTDGFLQVTAIDAAAPVHDLLLYRRELYLRVGDQVARYELGKRTPTWTAAERCRGRLALRGAYVYGVEYERDGAYIRSWRRADALSPDRRLIGHHDGKVPDASDVSPRVQAFEREVLVHSELGIRMSGGGTANMAGADRIFAKDGSAFLSDSGLWTAASEAAAWPTGWIGAMVGKSGKPELWATDVDDKHWTLATMDSQPKFANPAVPPSVAGGVAYFGGTAVDLAAREILWTSPVEPAFRAVPARDAVVLADAGSTVLCLREPRAAHAKASILVPLPDAGVQGRVVLRDGSVAAGLLRAKSAAEISVDGTPPRTVPLEDVLVAEDAAGQIVAAAPGAEAVEGIDVLALRETAQAYAAVAVQAVASRDAALVERLVAEASTRGAEPKDYSRAESFLKDAASKPKPAAVNAAEADKAAAAEKDAAATPARVFWERAKRLPPAAPPSLVVEIVARILDADPAHADAAAKVRSMLPTGVTPPEPFDPRDWLSFVRATQFTPVELVKPPAPDAPDITPGQRLLGMYLGVWRKDLVALQSKQLLVISAPVKPGRIANCLSAGELVCDTLERFFASGKHVRDHRWPMTILLFENREEYRKVVGRDAADDDEKRMAEWSVGQYSPGDGSRLYLPEDEDGFRRVMKTFVHELTHQWLAERCPLYAAAEGGPKRSGGGHFVVEGFAEMVEEMRFDLARRTCTFDPAAESLDTMGALPPNAAFAWPAFFALSSKDFQHLDLENVIPVARRRSLGGVAKLSQGHVFYAQSAAAAHCLFQMDGGKLRQAFLEYTAAHYAGRTPSIKDAFGMSEEELGARVIAFAKSPAAAK